MYSKTFWNQIVNESIIKLAKQSGFVFWEDERSIDWASNYDNELNKFTKLIIQECCAIADNWVNNLDDGKNYPSERIKEYFGVRE